MTQQCENNYASLGSVFSAPLSMPQSAEPEPEAMLVPKRFKTLAGHSTHSQTKVSMHSSTLTQIIRPT